MKLDIYSREVIEKTNKYEFPENTVAISFYDPTPHYNSPNYKPVDYSKKVDKVFYIPLRDIDVEILPNYNLTYETYFPEVEELAKFIYDAVENRYDIICQCEFGQSRSAGCAAAIREHFYRDGIRIFADYRYYPNQMVYHKVYDALKSERARRNELKIEV